ncbi:hypothetical protein [Paenibacillus bovis]|uniref:Amino acid transporter n=1 Tax=Paenibacillus bovis TaxID=1616788 RepID=A0A172ZH87_9BACL|nr:hypothetical protein [Paenibacillus bovis]ANF96647.1 hypothetical protein AR543_11935 [Paenibacillus bovis]
MKTEKCDQQQLEQTESHEVTSFNSVTEHYHTVVGVPRHSVEMSTIPAPIRWFGYFGFGGIVVGAVTMIIVAFFH